MKTIPISPKNGLIAFAFLLSLIFITNPVLSQDSLKSHHQKKQIKLVVSTDKNGKTSSFDTTINFGEMMDQAQIKEIMKQYDVDLEGFSNDLNNMYVQIEGMDSSDSGNVDSLSRKVKKIRIFGDEGKGHKKGHGFNYDYSIDMRDFSDVPPPPPPPPPTEGYTDFFDGYPGFESFGRNQDERRNTLSDLLGDIPMDMVKSYSIKETKNGKKIVIELNNDPMFERHHNVIIYQEPRHASSNHRHRNTHMTKKVILQTGDEEGPKVVKSKM